MKETIPSISLFKKKKKSLAAMDTEVLDSCKPY